MNQRSSTPSVLREGDLVSRAAQRIAGHVNRSGEWESITYRTRNLSRYAEGDLIVGRASGDDRSLAIPLEAHEELVELREVMHREGSGTWFSMKLVLTNRNGRVQVHGTYNYDEIPEWDMHPASSLYTWDLVKFPRDDIHIPAWLSDRIEAARVEYPDEFDAYEQTLRRQGPH